MRISLPKIFYKLNNWFYMDIFISTLGETAVSWHVIKCLCTIEFETNTFFEENISNT